MQYRKKPVIINAFQWTGRPDQTEDPEWIVDAIKRKEVWFETGRDNPFLDAGECRMVIKTLEGNHIANVGDYIIQGVKGEIYPCKPDIFEMTYDKIEDARQDNIEEKPASV
jgi:hypothetical protein